MISSDHCDVMVFGKLRFQDVFRPHEKENPEFSNSFGLKGDFKNLRFRDGLVWTSRTNGRNKAAFSHEFL